MDGVNVPAPGGAWVAQSMVRFAVPVVSVLRGGFRLRPTFHLRDPILRRLARQGAWAAGFLGCSQALLVAVLYFANGSEGGVVVYQLAFVLFMLPVSLFAVPVFTTAFPDLTRFARTGRWADFGDEVGRTTRSVALFTIASTGALVALAEPISRVVALGNAADHVTEVAGAVAGFAVGVPGYAMVLLLTRVAYSYQDTRTPTLVNIGVAVLGTTLMAVMAAIAPSSDRITVLGLGYGSAQLVGAVVLAVSVRATVHGHGARIPTVAVPILRDVVAAPHGLEALALVMRYVLLVSDHVEPPALAAPLAPAAGPATPGADEARGASASSRSLAAARTAFTLARFTTYSSCAASLPGPNTAIPASRRLSAMPSTSGPSGPTTTSPMS